jgi:hypothetical protein
LFCAAGNLKREHTPKIFKGKYLDEGNEIKIT